MTTAPPVCAASVDHCGLVCVGVQTGVMWSDDDEDDDSDGVILQTLFAAADSQTFCRLLPR